MKTLISILPHKVLKKSTKRTRKGAAKGKEIEEFAQKLNTPPDINQAY